MDFTWTWSWTSVALLTATIFLFEAFRRKTKRLPPGPLGLPILGSLHLLGKLPHRDLHKLSLKYGSIMYMRFGFIPTVIVSSPRAAEQFLKTHDLIFASRPFTQAVRYITYGSKDIAFAPYGSYWGGMRKMCTLELLSNLKINSFKPVRKEEVDLFINSVKEADGGAAIDLSSMTSSLAMDMTFRMVFGKKYLDNDYGDKEIKTAVQDVLKLVGSINWGDYIPPIAGLDLQGLTKQMQIVMKLFDELFEKIIDEHNQTKGENRTKDFVDIMLNLMESEQSEYRVERQNIKAVLLDMLTAAMDTSAATIEWALSELMKHPVAMKKVQKELEDVVGINRMVDESDLESLEYLNMVVKETLRLHPVAPLLIPHESIEDCSVDGYHIPKKTRVMVNAWSIGRDPDAWTEPEKFWPERFIGSNIDLRGRDFQLIPFGSGRRACPGLQLGLTMVRLVVSQTVHCFDWELPDNMLPADLDMTEEFSLVTPRLVPLTAIPTYRLKM